MGPTSSLYDARHTATPSIHNIVNPPPPVFEGIELNNTDQGSFIQRCVRTVSWGLVIIGAVSIYVPQAMRMQTEMELRMFRQNEFMYHKMREAALNNQPMQVMAEPSNEPAPALFHKKQ